MDLALVLAQILIPSVSEAWAWIQVGQGGGGHENLAASYTGQIATREKKTIKKKISYEVDEIIVNRGLSRYVLLTYFAGGLSLPQEPSQSDQKGASLFGAIGIKGTGEWKNKLWGWIYTLSGYSLRL